MGWFEENDVRAGYFAGEFDWPTELILKVKSAISDASYEVFGAYEWDESQAEKSQASALLIDLLSEIDPGGAGGWADFVAGKSAPSAPPQPIPTGETAAQYAERLIKTVGEENGWTDAEITYALLGIDSGEKAKSGTASVDEPEFWVPVRDNLRSYVYEWPQGWEELAQAIEALHKLKKYEDEKIGTVLTGAGEDLLKGGSDFGKIAIGVAGLILLGKFL